VPRMTASRANCALTGVTILTFLLCHGLAAENLEKAQKKDLEAQAKAIIVEAKSLETSGQLAEARAKYAESQAMIETNDAADAIKRLDDQIHKRVKDTLSGSRKLYDAHKFKEAAAALEEGMKLGAGQSVLAHNLALCYFQLGERGKAAEYLEKSIEGTPDPREKQKLEQLLTFFTTREQAASVGDRDKERIAQVNRLTDRVGMEASLEDEAGGEEEEAFSDGGALPLQSVSQSSPAANRSAAGDSHSTASHRTSLCTALEELKDTTANSPAAVFNRANCAENNGHPAEAVRLLQKYLELSPDALDAGDVRAHTAELQLLLSLSGPNAPEMRQLFASAYNYMAERKYDRVLAAYTRAGQLFPEFPVTHWRLALLHEAMGNVDQAREQFTRYQQLTPEQSARDEAQLHVTTLEAKKPRYDEEVDAAEEILSDLFNRGMNLSFNLGKDRSAIHPKRARIKKKQDRGKDRNRVGGFAVPYAYAQQELGRASDHLQLALALFPLGAEANELMGLVFLQANDGRAATRCFDAVASQGLPVAFYAEMRGHKLDHAAKCELTRDHVRLIFLSSYDKKGLPSAPDKPAGDDGLGDMTLVPSDERQPFDSLELSVSDIKKVQTSKGLLTLELAKDKFTLAPIYLPSFTPVEGPPARRFANNYTRLFIRYPGLEDSKLGAEGMTGGEKFVMGYKLASAGMNMATSGFSGIGAFQSAMDAISIARTIHSAMASLSVSFASWERSVRDQQQLLLGLSFKPIPTEPASLGFLQDVKK